MSDKRAGSSRNIPAVGYFDRLFYVSAVFALFVFVAFISSYIIAMLVYTDTGSLISAALSTEIITALKLTLVTATIATILAVMLSVPAAYFLARNEFPGKTILDTFLDLPIVMPPVALGFALLVFFSTGIGNEIENAGFRFVFERPGIILAQFAVISSFTLKTVKTVFEAVDPRYEHVARTLGAGAFEAFFRITLPLSRNGLIASTLMSWAKAIGEFGAAITLVGAIKNKTEILSIAIWLNLEQANLNMAIAVVMIMLVIAGTILYLTRKLIGKGYVI